jgi:signal transduction histidine kinase
MSAPDRGSLGRLAQHLREQRAALLRAWREAVDRDPEISTADTLARTQFVDHVPRILEAFEQQLLEAAKGGERPAASDEQRQATLDHGVHRWLHGYHYRETMREWGHLQTCLAQAVEQFTLSEPDLDPRAMSVARRMLVQLFVDCMVESAAAQVRLQQAEAASRLRDLEQAVEQLRLLARERADLWREAAHDLRGNVSAVHLAASALAKAAAPGTGADVIARTTQTLSALLDDLTALARLEAGREVRNVASFDAGQLVRELCAELQPHAAGRGLSLTVTAGALPVAGDAIKVRRIAQNLILNGLKFTERGGVHVEATESHPGQMPGWQLSVEDTGVGISERASPAIARVLREATRHEEALAASSAGAPFDPVHTLQSESSRLPRGATGEGIGLTIVKRLCELLDATIHIESTPGSGTTFRIMFPRSYPANQLAREATAEGS